MIQRLDLRLVLELRISCLHSIKGWLPFKETWLVHGTLWCCARNSFLGLRNSKVLDASSCNTGLLSKTPGLSVSLSSLNWLVLIMDNNHKQFPIAYKRNKLSSELGSVEYLKNLILGCYSYFATVSRIRYHPLILHRR